MNPLDMVILAIIAFNAILGLMRGAIWQILRFASIALGFYVAHKYGEVFLARWPENIRNQTSYAIVVARVVLFMSVYIVMFGITHMVKAFVDKIQLGSVDRLLGAVVGATKGAAFCCVILYLQFIPPISTFPMVKQYLYGDGEKGIKGSKVNDYFIKEVKPRLEQSLPKEVIQKVDEMKSKAEASFK